MPQFVTPFGCYKYLTNSQGNHMSGNAYNQRFDMVTAEVSNVVRQVDDSLLWQPTITEAFKHTADYLTLLGRNGILQKPNKFQFCQKQVHWSGYTIGEDTVKPISHISGTIRNFPTPATRTNLRSFMALVQQVSYATAVTPKLLQFRNLMKEITPWDKEVDKVFREVRVQMADRVEEGIKLFDPNKTTALLTDWCKHGLGFLMMQKQCSCPNKQVNEHAVLPHGMGGLHGGVEIHPHSRGELIPHRRQTSRCSRCSTQDKILHPGQPRSDSRHRPHAPPRTPRQQAPRCPRQPEPSQPQAEDAGLAVQGGLHPREAVRQHRRSLQVWGPPLQ